MLHIALTGLPRAGKDEVGKVLVSEGFVRLATGDYAKRACNALINEQYGFSAWVEEDEKKDKIRPRLRKYVDDNYDAIMADIFRVERPYVVNTRIIRLHEAKDWHDRGGIIWDVRRPGNMATVNAAEADAYQEIVDSGIIDCDVINDSSLDELHIQVVDLLGMCGFYAG